MPPTTKLEHALDAAARGFRFIELPLRNKHGALVAVARIDVDDAQLAEHRWCLREGGYAVRMSRGKMLRLHRVVMGCTPGDGVVVDHIDGDRLNCCRSNLRCGTQALNAQNRAHADMRGAQRHAQSGRWRARVKLNYREHHLGLFDTQEEAAEAAALFRAANMPFSREATHAV